MSTPAAPQHCPSPRELDDLELLASGALTPLTSFNTPDSPITIDLPDDLAAAEAVELVDPEGLPLARLTRDGHGGWAVEALTHPQHGPFRRLHLTPAQVRAEHAGRTFVPLTGPVTDTQLDQLADLGPVTFLALVGTGTPDLSPVALLRATLRVAEALPDAAVVAVPLASHGDPEADHALGVQVTATYAGPDPVVGLIQSGTVLTELDDILEADRPDPAAQGLVLFFTGLSGSGKSTLARALMDRLLEQGVRTVTSLDGDVVRRNLSAGLSFSKADRETNIRRIGWVAAEISRHGGVAVVSPIAPYDETRQQVRAMVEEAGGAFFLVHVATPLAECERRDRKGLYAKARRGEIPEFTGISSPYEEPTDADVRVDTTGRTIEDALDDVVETLAASGYADLREIDAPVSTASRRSSVTAPPSSPPLSTPSPSSLETAPRRHLRLLFVGTTGTGRAAYLELAARPLLADAPVEVLSAGTRATGGDEPDAALAAELTRRGVDPTTFRSRPLTRELVTEADLVVTTEVAHRTTVLEDHPGIPAPVLTVGQLVRVVTALGPGLSREDLLAALGERAGVVDPLLDVPDPHGRGVEAAEATAHHLDGLLRVLVPVLTDSEKITS